MSETTWSEEGDRERAPKKKGVPSWVWWGCGGGCLLLTLALAALGVFAARTFRASTDPEKQWPKLGEVLHFEQRPAGLELAFGLSLGADQFHLLDAEKGLRATLIEFPPTADSDYRQLMNPDASLPLGLGQPIEPEEGTLSIQGKVVPCLRFTRIKPEPEEGEGPGIRVDLTGERSRPRTLELRRRAAGRIEDAEVEAFLAPFQVWRAP